MPGETLDNTARAEVLHGLLRDRFWSPRQRLFRIVEGRALTRFGPWHHWWQSQALSALLDRHDRTGEQSARTQAEDLVEGMRRRGRGLVNDFYDDVGWLALALLRMPGRERDLATLLARLRAGEMPEGGIAWSVGHPEFRNVPATGPAALVALRLAARNGDAELGAWGLRLTRWMHDTVVGPDGHVADGLRRHGDGTTSVDLSRYSYNYGSVVGASMAAHALTGDPADLDRARRVAAAAVRELSDPATGVWRSEGAHDRALFRGILARRLADLALVTDYGALADVVRVQADAVWRACAGGPVGAHWPAPSNGRVELSGHVGGLLVVEAAARLDVARG